MGRSCAWLRQERAGGGRQWLGGGGGGGGGLAGVGGAGRGGRRLSGALLRSLRSCSDKFQQSLIGGAPDPFHRQWLDIPVMRAETCTHSANYADDRQDSPGAVLGPGVDMPVIVQRHMHISRLSRSSTSLSWRRSCPVVLIAQKNIEILHLQSIEKVVDVSLGRSSRFHVCSL